jgi:hypothetical protein
MCEDVRPCCLYCALYLYVQLCCVLGLCKDAYILWFAKVFSGLEPHPKQGPTMRTLVPSLYFDFKIDFLHCWKSWEGRPSQRVHKTTYAPVIYTPLCIMFWRRGYTLLGEVGGGWALEFPSFLGPKWLSPIGSLPFHRAQKTREFQGPTPSNFPT